MSRQKTFVENFAETELIIIEEGFKYGKSVDFRQHCQVLLLSNRGYEVKQIAPVLEVCSQMVYSTIQA